MSRVEPNRNVYVGHRYVPKIFGEWDKQNEYEGLSIVTHKGASYTSKKRVPVGIDILNEEFWVITGNYNAQVDYYREEVQTFNSRINDNKKNTERIETELNQKIDTTETELNQKIETTETELNQKIDTTENELTDSILNYDLIDHTIYVNSSTGDDNGDGFNSPFKTLGKAINYLKSLTDKGAEGRWTIKLSGTFTQGVRISQLPKLRYPLQIEGDVSDTGVPMTIFNGASSTSVNGMWFEPMGDTSIQIRNIIFTNWRSYAVIMKDKGQLLVDNCQFTDCYFGVGGVNQNRTTVHHSIFTRCETGVVSQYNSTLTVGSTSNTFYTKNIFNECRYGVSVSRNSVAHVDYNEINTSTISGVIVLENSRANCVGNTFKNNNRGVMVQAGAEWLNNKNEFNGSIEYDYQHFGTGKETRMYSQSTNIDYRYPPGKPNPTDYTGDKSNKNHNVFTFPSTSNIPKGFLKGVGKKVTVKVYGHVVNNPNKATGEISVTTVDTATGSGASSIGVTNINNLVGSFVYEVEATNVVDGGQFVSNQLMTNRNDTVIANTTRNIPIDTDRSVRVTFRSDDPLFEIRFLHVELSIAG